MGTLKNFRAEDFSKGKKTKKAKSEPHVESDTTVETVAEVVEAKPATKKKSPETKVTRKDDGN